jgi:hypothetical protein
VAQPEAVKECSGNIGNLGKESKTLHATFSMKQGMPLEKRPPLDRTQDGQATYTNQKII